MNTKRKVAAICFLVVSLLISGCGVNQPPKPTVSSTPKGVARGTLIGKDNLPDKNAQVLLCTANGDKVNFFTQDKTLPSTSSDENGAFTFTNIPSGKYCLLIFDGQTGTVAVVLTSENKIFTFEVLDMTGVDLGDVSIANVRKL